MKHLDWPWTRWRVQSAFGFKIGGCGINQGLLRQRRDLLLNFLGLLKNSEFQTLLTRTVTGRYGQNRGDEFGK